jgi:DNA-binding LacI/PurR family transcriptional regulator
MPETTQTSRRKGRPPRGNCRYRTIAADIVRRLDSGEWPVGKPMPSFRLLAQSYGVGTKTIQLALNVLRHDGRVSIEAKRPMLASLGRPLSTLLTKSLGIVMNSGIASTCNPGNVHSLWRGIALNAHRIGLTLVMLSDDRLWKKEFPAGLRDLPLSGILLTGPFPDYLLRQYASLEVPIVLLDQPGDGYALHSVSVGNYEAAYDATMRLIQLGHERIAFARSIVGSLKNIDPDSKEREEGFRAACRKSGVDTGQVFSVGFHAVGSPAARAIVRFKPAFTAVLCATSAHAEQVSREARSAGLRVPRDLSIATFECRGRWTPDWSGPHIDFEEFGRLGIDLLIRKPKSPQHIRVKTTWNEGDSIAPAPRR